MDAHHCAVHVQCLPREVDVFAPKLGELAEPEPTPRGQQHQGPQPCRHGLHDGVQVSQGDGLDLSTASGHARTLDGARVADGQPTFSLCLVEQGLEQRVGVGTLGRSLWIEVVVPCLHVVPGDRSHGPVT